MEVAKLIKSVWFLLVLASDMSLCNGDEVHAHLRRLNKSPHISFMSPDGDIIDCVHISQQLAFDHPSLKNHSIQMRPSYTPNGLRNKKAVSIRQIWHLNGTCPKETIPIRRTKREDVLRAVSIDSFGMKQHNAIKHQEPPAEGAGQHEYATAYVEGKYYGAKATINLWSPAIQQPDEFSLSQLWVVAAPIDSNLNTIEVGWQVYPWLYGDSQTRLFIYWTTDNYRHTGCYNLLCSGFIQTNRRIAIGGAFSPVSHYKGAQHEITILVWKDTKGGDWWLKIGNSIIGYWPSKLFNRLNTHASRVKWGGEVVNKKANGKHTTTDMGSGHFPHEGYGKASFFRNIQTIDGTTTLRSPNRLTTSVFPSKSCYDIKIGNTYIAKWGSYFYYGGSGQNAACS